jgi:hypothetical protein
LRFGNDNGFLGADRLPATVSVDEDVGKYVAADLFSGIVVDAYYSVSLGDITEQPNLQMNEASVAIRRTRSSVGTSVALIHWFSSVKIACRSLSGKRLGAAAPASEPKDRAVSTIVEIRPMRGRIKKWHPFSANSSSNIRPCLEIRQTGHSAALARQGPVLFVRPATPHFESALRWHLKQQCDAAAVAYSERYPDEEVNLNAEV